MRRLFVLLIGLAMLAPAAATAQDAPTETCDAALERETLRADLVGDVRAYAERETARAIAVLKRQVRGRDAELERLRKELADAKAPKKPEANTP